MKVLNILGSALLIIALFSFFYLSKESQEIWRPAPTGDIEVFEGHREGEGLGDKRRTWIEKMHRAAPEVDWRKMDRDFRWKRHLLKAKEQGKTKETFAGGIVEAEWVERGSLNQAGNLAQVEYDLTQDAVYGISGGGTVWKSNINGTSWTPLNEDLQFHSAILSIQYQGSASRIFASIGKQLHYSTDDGATWNLCTDVVFDDGWGMPISIETKDNGEVYYLAFTFDNSAGDSRMWLYYSNDYGVSFSRIKVFNHNINYWDARNRTSMWSHKDMDKVYFVHLGNETYEAQNGVLTQLTNSSGLPTNQPYDLEGSLAFGSILKNLFVLVNSDQVYKSTDAGLSWSSVSNLPTNAWSVGIAVNPFDDSKFTYGEVEAYRSLNNGSSWSRINTWGSYYSNINRLHADIMDIEYVKKADGTEVLLVANHGGLHASYDAGVSFDNISKSGLNIAQYYDVRTDPTDENYIYGGTQDQGHHRTNTGIGYSITNFEQVISGDYGHMAFSKSNQSLWTVYPGSWFTYYPNPKTGGYASSFTMGGNNLAANGWICPTAETTLALDNSILAAGGNILGGNGAHLVKLTAANNAPHPISATQYNFDFRANSNSGNATISAIENSPILPSRIYVATEDGTFFYSNNSGTSFNKTSSFSGPGQYWLYGATILGSKIDSDIVWFGGSGYSNPAIYLSTDGGANFSPMSNGLPNTLVYEMVANDDESLIFAGTEVGPYVYVTAQNQWYPIAGNAAPTQQYQSVEFISSQNTARFATHGRGIWDFVIDKDCEIFSEFHDPVQQNLNLEVIQTITTSSTIDPNKNVLLDAGEYILLEPDFETPMSTAFEAKIDGCID